jgi:hypothetical protein
MYVTDTGTVVGHTYANFKVGGAIAYISTFTGTIDANGKFTATIDDGTTLEGTLTGATTTSGTTTSLSGTLASSVDSVPAFSGAFSGTREVPFTPATRFTDMGNGVIYDGVTHLYWLKNADCFGTLTWDAAVSKAAALSSGQCGLSDGSGANSWRLPTVSELLRFVDDGYLADALTSSGFSTVKPDYWSGDVSAFDISDLTAWSINLSNTLIPVESGSSLRTATHHVWFVKK